MVLENSQCVNVTKVYQLINAKMTATAKNFQNILDNYGLFLM